MGQFCGACGANVLQPGHGVLHPRLDDAHVLCGNTSQRALTYINPDDVPPPMRDPLADARRELEVVAAALTYHNLHEDTPCEVNTEGGWMDVIELLEPLAKVINGN